MRHESSLCGGNCMLREDAVARETGCPSLYWDMAPNFLLGITLVIPSGFVFDLTYHVLH